MELNTAHKILSKSFTKTIKKYKDIYKLLDPLVKKFWEENRGECWNLG